MGMHNPSWRFTGRKEVASGSCNEIVAMPLLMRLPLLRSILNQANRVPQNANFDQDRARNVVAFVEAIKNQLNVDSSPEMQLAVRITKYTTMLKSVGTVPIHGSFDDDPKANLVTLLDKLNDKWKEPNRSPGGFHNHSHGVPGDSGTLRVIVAHEGADELAAHLKISLLKHKIEVALLPSDDENWFAACEQSSVCIPLLNARFLRSALCEAQFTFAKDNNIMLLPIVADDSSYQEVMGGESPLPQVPSPTASLNSTCSPREWRKRGSNLSSRKLDLSKKKPG